MQAWLHTRTNDVVVLHRQVDDNKQYYGQDNRFNHFTHKAMLLLEWLLRFQNLHLHILSVLYSQPAR